MRLRIGIVSFLALTVGGFAALSLLRGQERLAAPPPSAPVPHDTVKGAAPAQLLPDLSKLSEIQKESLLSAQRGAEWLFRMNTVKGRFTPGLAPALQDVVLEDDHYLRQAGSAYALARAARLLREDRYTVRATQTRQRAVGPRSHLVRQLSPRAAVAPQAPVRPLRQDLRRRQPFVVTVVPLAQVL